MEPRRHALEDYDEPFAMRLSSCEKTQHRPAILYEVSASFGRQRGAIVPVQMRATDLHYCGTRSWLRLLPIAFSSLLRTARSTLPRVHVLSCASAALKIGHLNSHGSARAQQRSS